jgi:hypothetical protein
VEPGFDPHGPCPLSRRARRLRRRPRLAAGWGRWACRLGRCPETPPARSFPTQVANDLGAP